uniref:Uncharacterized protein n=1 Tax=Oryza rufipogon TaxID=4529 RepID=A0A0E0P882_ORYRU
MMGDGVWKIHGGLWIGRQQRPGNGGGTLAMPNNLGGVDAAAGQIPPTVVADWAPFVHRHLARHRRRHRRQCSPSTHTRTVPNPDDTAAPEDVVSFHRVWLGRSSAADVATGISELMLKEEL